MQYSVTLPNDPTPSHPTQPGKGYNFELNGALWFGMALCDTQSYPEQVSTCTPDSDSNIVDPAVSPNHPGTAFMELQFYPPGWVPWPTWAVAVGADTCSPTQWCAAMNVFSLLEDPVNGTMQNPTCAAQVGIETFQFAFVTKNGVAQAPANPLRLDAGHVHAEQAPGPVHELGRPAAGEHPRHAGRRAGADQRPDQQQVWLDDGEPGQRVRPDPVRPDRHELQRDPLRLPPDVQHRLRADPGDLGGAQLQRRRSPTRSVTSSSATGRRSRRRRSGWTLTATRSSARQATPRAAARTSSRRTRDDDFCFPASEALLYRVQGCTETNTGFDGVSYTPVWPDGNTKLHPTPFQFTSARTGANFDQPYDRVAFEADLPADRAHLQPHDRGRLHADTGDRQRRPGAVLPVLHEHRRRRHVQLAVRERHPGRHAQLRAQRPVRVTAPADLPRASAVAAAPVDLFNNFRNIISNPC